MKKNLCVSIILFLFSSFDAVEANYHPNWTWRTVRTDKFTIYYPQGHEAFARRVLSISDEVYGDVTGYLGVKPRRCPIVLNPGTDLFNGYYSPLPNRISLYETPLYTVRGAGPGSDLLDMVFTHEYTHFAHITTRLGWFGALSRVFGDGLAVTNIISPGWMIEGVTTNTETLFTDGGRGRCHYFRGRMMSFSGGEGLWGLSGAGTSSPYAPPYGRFYLSGYHMIEYINQTYGEDAFARLSKFQARHPVLGVARGIRHVTGQSPGQFYRHFLEDFYARSDSIKAEVNADGLPAGTVVLEEPFESFTAHFWKDNGTIIALREGFDKHSVLVEADPVSGTIVNEIPTGTLNHLDVVRMDGENRLVYGAYYMHPLGGGDLISTDLTIFDPVQKHVKRVTKNAHIFAAAPSPDGSQYAAVRRDGMWSGLVLLDRNGNFTKALLDDPGVYVDAPAWSPDGTKITAVVKIGKNADIVFVDPADGGMETLFRPDADEDNEPAFSPDGQWIVFSSGRSGIWNIYAWNCREKRLYQLTSVPYAATDPKISPDGTMLSFLSLERDVNRVCVMPFRPVIGKPISVEPADDTPVPDLARVQPDFNLNDSGIPLWEAYKPFIHMPFSGYDEDGTTAGLFVMGADPVGLNQYIVQILYGIDSRRPGYDVNLTNRSFWPEINVRAYDSAIEGNTLGSERDTWFRERGGEISVVLPVIHRSSPSTVTASYRLGVRTRSFGGLNGTRVNPGFDRSVGVYSDIYISHIPDHAVRDMVPGWGRRVFISREEGLDEFGGQLPGHNTIVSLNQYTPSPFKHHGFLFRTSHQRQKGFLSYDKQISLPRGYNDDDKEGGMNLRKNLVFSCEYHFPIRFTDKGIGVMLYHMNLLKGSLFIDYGAGWNGKLDINDWQKKARTSVGGTVTTKSRFMSWVPVEFGIAAGYKIKDESSFVHFVMGIDF